MKPIEQLSSALKSIWIDIQRSADHFFRYWTGLPMRRRSMITPELFLGGQYSNLGLEKLHSQEFTAIVNMRTTSFETQAKEKGLQYLHLPTIDQHAVKMAHLLEGVAFISKEIENGGRVYIHCHAGEGRGPSMVIAYLISTGLTFEDAIDQVRKVRPFIRLTPDQAKRLGEFEKKVRV